jgi:hypothetical protein
MCQEITKVQWALPCIAALGCCGSWGWPWCVGVGVAPAAWLLVLASRAYEPAHLCEARACCMHPLPQKLLGNTCTKTNCRRLAAGAARGAGLHCGGGWLAARQPAVMLPALATLPGVRLPWAWSCRLPLWCLAGDLAGGPLPCTTRRLQFNGLQFNGLQFNGRRLVWGRSAGC